MPDKTQPSGKIADRSYLQKLARVQGVKYICPAHSGFSDDFQTAMAEWQGY